MQRHGNIKVERIIIAHVGNEKHGDQNEVVLYAYVWLDGAAFGREQESLDGYEEEL